MALICNHSKDFFINFCPLTLTRTDNYDGGNGIRIGRQETNESGDILGMGVRNKRRYRLTQFWQEYEMVVESVVLQSESE